MYNRYIPQPDGSYRRNSVQEPLQIPKPKQPNLPVHSTCTPTPQPVCAPPKSATPPNKSPHHQKKVPQKDVNIGTFLKQLLPRELDTGDLLVIILLLLMGGDKPEDRSHALLTLFLYLFL